MHGLDSSRWALLLVATIALSLAPALADDAPSVDRLRKHVAFLASDELAGRDSGEAGLEVAAEYIANRFREYGLEPAGDDGTYFHHFTVPGAPVFTHRAGVRIDRNGKEIEWRDGVDVAPMGIAEPGATSTIASGAPMVFVGYGIRTSAEDEKRGLEYDDYAKVDVRGKVVIVLRFTPQVRESTAFRGRRSPHAPFVAKLRRARDAGAAGVVFVTPPGEAEEPLVGFARRAAPREPMLPAVLAKRRVVDRLLALAEKPSLTEISRDIDEDLTPRSFELEGVRATFDTARGQLRLRNVVAELPGTDPARRSEALVVGGHYDHIGRFGAQVSPRHLGEIHNGADDNASGVAGVLEVARLAARSPPSRSVLFMAFSGEEIGLLGSRAWVDAQRTFRAKKALDLDTDPGRSSEDDEIGADGGDSGPAATTPNDRAARSVPAPAISLAAGAWLEATGRGDARRFEVAANDGARGWVDVSSVERVAGPRPVSSLVAMINLDMIGRSEESPAVTIFGAGTSAGFSDLVRASASDAGVDVETPLGRTAATSDHAPFARRKIPFLFFHTGITATYNQPGDDLETLNLPAATKICAVVLGVLRRLGNAESKPEFVDRPERQPRRKTLGVSVDTAYEGDGVRVASVLVDSIADNAGLRSGDVILRFADRDVGDVRELRRAIQRDGDGAVTLLVRRGEERVMLTAAFSARD